MITKFTDFYIYLKQISYTNFCQALGVHKSSILAKEKWFLMHQNIGEWVVFYQENSGALYSQFLKESNNPTIDIQLSEGQYWLSRNKNSIRKIYEIEGNEIIYKYKTLLNKEKGFILMQNTVDNFKKYYAGNLINSFEFPKD